MSATTLHAELLLRKPRIKFLFLSAYQFWTLQQRVHVGKILPHAIQQGPVFPPQSMQYHGW